MSAVPPHYADRLDLARTREFAQPGAGVARRSRLAENARGFLRGQWDDAMRARGLAPDTPGVALALVGSQARGDAGPLSDYDIVLLHDGHGAASRGIDALAEALWYPMWDAGVRFDHSVRTLGECRKVAAGDLTAAIGMLDITPVAGDEVIVAGVRQGIAHDWRGNARKRLTELVESFEQRHERFGDLGTVQAPDLKESGGGLRDLSIIGALTTAWLADPSRARLDEAQGVLLDVRDALHVVTGRGRERLALQDQDAVAALLGLHDSDELLTRVVDAGRTISYVADGALRSAGQSQRARTLRVGPRKPSMTPLGHGLHLHDGEVVLGTGRRGGGHLLLLRAATAAARRQARIGPKTLANLARELPPLETPWPRPMREAFVELLASGPGLVEVWEALDHAGVIDAWIPEWRGVRSRPQRNAVHRFTVDRHIIETVVEAAALRGRVGRPDLLMVGALLHDIGKVAGSRDHSLDGAPVARSICERMGFDAGDVDVVERLVREHLTLVDLATKRDPEDPATVEALCGAVRERAEVLDLLVMLTGADAKAAGPQAWTAWRAGLVHALANRAAGVLGSPVRAPEEPQEDGPRELLSPEVTRRVRDGDVVVQIEPAAVGAVITIVDVDRLGLFGDMAGVLGLHRVTVRSATLHTIAGLAVNTWYVEAPHGVLPQVDDVERALRALRKGDRTPVRALERSIGPKALASEPLPNSTMARASAFVIPWASQDATVVEVRAGDRIGLLFDVGAAFAAVGVSVRSAHIATYAGQSADTFYITSARSGGPLEPPHAAQVIGAVIDAASAPI